MKVTPPKNTPEQPPPTTNKITSRRVSSQTNTVPHEDDGALASAHTRDFASVLEDVTRSVERDENESSEGERQDTKTSAHAERERESKRREDRHDGSGTGGGFEQRGQVRDAGHVSEAAPARAILHIADLERLVAAVRTQLLSGGRQEVTLELHRSVLEGLRVRLTTDGQGRVNAEFIAASEKVRAQLDARAGDLNDLLRGRGVELASLRTTVGADANQTATGDGGHRAPDNSPRVVSGRDDAPASAAAEDSLPDERIADESTSSYRA